MENEVAIKDGRVLRDGFQQILAFSGHHSVLRGYSHVELYDDKQKKPRQSISTHHSVAEQFISWDLKSLILWEADVRGFGKILHQIKFPMSKPGFISCIVYVAQLRIYLAATTDVSFQIFDKNLNLVESINHGSLSKLHVQFIFIAHLIISNR
jgi:hypothetical protein